MSQRNLHNETSYNSQQQSGHHIQFDSVKIDLSLLDAEMKANLVAMLGKKVVELSRKTGQPFDMSNWANVAAEAKIVKLAQCLNELQVLTKKRKQIEQSLQKENSTTASPVSRPTAHQTRTNAAPNTNTQSQAIAQQKTVSEKEKLQSRLQREKNNLLNKSAPQKSKAAPVKAKAATMQEDKSEGILTRLLSLFQKNDIDQPANLGKAATRKTASTPRKIALPPAEDDPDLEAGNFFSLDKHYLESLRRRPQIVRKDAVIDIEIATLSNKRLRDLHLVRPGDNFKIKQSFVPHSLVQVKRDGSHTIQMPKDITRAILHRGAEASELQPKEKLHLQLGEWIDLRSDSLHYLIRPIMEPKLKPFKQQTVEQTAWKKYLGGSTAAHLLLIVLFGLVTMVTQSQKPEEEPEFVQIDLSQLVDEPKPEPKKPEPKKPEPIKVEPKPAPKEPVKVAPKPPKVVAPKPQPQPKKPAPPAPPKDVGGGNKDGGNIAQRNVKATGLLAALGTTSATTPSSDNALAQVTNLDTVEAPSDSGGLKVAGLSAKVEGVRTSVPSGELVNTAGKDGVLRSGGMAGDGNLAALEQGTAGKGQVRASVSATLSKQVKVQGGISRAAVKKVIDAHLSEITYCYETALMYDANLGGKISFEWTILASGKVGNTGIESSTVQSSRLHNCIRSAIQSWEFPKPKGTEVVVSYPFVFDMVGF